MHWDAELKLSPDRDGYIIFIRGLYIGTLEYDDDDIGIEGKKGWVAYPIDTYGIETVIAGEPWETPRQAIKDIAAHFGIFEKEGYAP